MQRFFEKMSFCDDILTFLIALDALFAGFSAISFDGQGARFNMSISALPPPSAGRRWGPGKQAPPDRYATCAGGCLELYITKYLTMISE